MNLATTIATVTTVALFTSVVGLVLWLYRPNSKRIYEHNSMIPLRDGEITIKGKKSDKRRKANKRKAKAK